MDLYNQSKFAVVVLNSELARRFGGGGLSCIVVHPGESFLSFFFFFFTPSLFLLPLRPSRDISANTSLFSGMINTNLGRDIPPLQMKIMSYINYDTHFGAITSLYAASAEETENANGKYFVAFARPAEVSEKCLEPRVGEELWKWFEEQVKGF